ncbi:MAG: Spx/MgsR family RNA polymerase-binding regulatory protein [Colwellia sp.]|nr:Spx/MgsR family RNA polymerase-binding regulatory protein [Colwellia sp.]
MTTIYGINNCDTVKKATKWLDKQTIEYTFFDFKKQPLTAELLTEFVKKSSWDVLLNKRSTTFRNLPAEIKDNLTDDVVFQAVLAQPTLLKRPLIDHNNSFQVGFKEPLYQALFLS